MADLAATERHQRSHDAEGRPVGHPPPILFVGGTGRSGTHVLAKLISRHPRLAMFPMEVRFHVEERGFPGLLAGRVSKQQFVERLRGFWWRGFQTRRMRGLSLMSFRNSRLIQTLCYAPGEDQEAYW